MTEALSTEALAGARDTAITLLSRHEHSQKELRQKLQTRAVDAGVIDQVLFDLTQENLQSDTRFAEAYINSRMQRGYGPIRLKQELRERGIDDELISVALDEYDIDWQTQLVETREKKFGSDLPSDYKEQAKQSRFLQYRGFTHDQIRQLFRA